MKLVEFFLPVTIAVLGPLTHAQSYEFVVNEETSSTDRSIEIEAPFAGTLIGNYDEKSNPEGTRTVPGIFGGSGNNPISYSASFHLMGSNESVPSGSFGLDVDSERVLATMTGLSVDLLGGTTEEVDLTLYLLYETFRTFSPSSLFPGGIELPIPLGAVEIRSMTLVQTAEVELLIIEGDEGAPATITGAIPAEITTEVVIFEQEIGGLPIPTLLPVMGTFSQDDDGAQVVLEAEIEFDEVLPATGVPFEDVPVEFPTVLPPGSIASLLLSGETTEGSFGGTFNLMVVADADNPSCPEDPDLNGDGMVDGADLTILLGDWNVPGGPADINCDEIVDGFDLTILLGSWTS